MYMGCIYIEHYVYNVRVYIDRVYKWLKHTNLFQQVPTINYCT